MKKAVLYSLMFATVTATANDLGKVTWETLGNKMTQEKKSYYTQRYTVEGAEPFDALAFCIVAVDMTPVNPEDTVLEILPGYYQISSPRFGQINSDKPVTIDIITWQPLQHALNIPGGIHLVRNGVAVPVQYEHKPLTSFKEQWVNPVNGRDLMIYGEEAFRNNEKLKSAYRTTPYNQIPTPKKIVLKNEKLDASELIPDNYNIEKIEDERNDYWTAEIDSKGITIKTNSEHPSVIADNLARRIKESTDTEGKVQAASIEDWSDLSYRGFMFDVGRNFLPKESTMQVIDIMSRYGLNTLHFHLGEDEGWRVEIPSLPELTMVGGRRGYTLTDDVPFLKGIYFGDGNPDSPTTANGFYTVDDFVEILKYANSKGIKVIPEFDTPGHSRAAIRAMEWRAKTTGDTSLRLIHDGDTSRYSTAQDFHDNTMNPALEGPYKFWSIVMDDIAAIYNKAGVPFETINIGGDEVAKGVWDGSDKAQALMKEKGMNSQRELHAYFAQKVAEIAKEKGLKIAGWAEIASKHSPEYDSIMIPLIEYVNVWSYSKNKEAQELVKKGYPVVMSNVDLLYFDHNQSKHPEEPGMYWGGDITEFSPFNATVDSVIGADKNLQSDVKGISAQIFSETVQDFPMVERYMLPRILGLAERAHNSHNTLDEEEYFGLITQEMPIWEKEGRNFYLRQPGILRENGMILMNEPYGLGEIRYTIDGTEPNRESQLYTGPFEDTGKDVRAKLFYGKAQSATSLSLK